MKQSTNNVNFHKRWTHRAANLLNSLAVFAIVLTTVSSVQAQEKSTARQIESLAAVYDLQNQGVANGQSRIIFYNPGTSSLPGAATVYINGRYHASLIAGAYSPVCLPPGKVELGTRQIDIQKRANKDGLDSMTLVSLQNGQNQYVRVQGDSKKTIALIPVNASEAQKELAQNLKTGGTWSNAGTVTQGGNTFNVWENASTNSQVIVQSGVTVNQDVAPVVFDLNADGVLSYSFNLIDVNGNGTPSYSAWAAKQDGVLVWNKLGDGVVHDASQYAFTQYGGNTDLEGLRAGFDSNGDGVFNAQDAKFAEFAVWQDANGNGVSDAGEVKSLADWGIASINLASDGVSRTPAAGVSEAGRTSATLAAFGAAGPGDFVVDAGFGGDARGDVVAFVGFEFQK